MFATSVVHRVAKTILNVVFPAVCLGCGEEGTYLCATCSVDLPRLEGPLCPCCGTPMPVRALCGHCALRLPSADGIRSVFAMEGVIRDAVHGLKYGQLRVLAGPLAREMALELESMPFAPDVIAPVPLHWRRLRERGYNQSALLAREVGAEAGLVKSPWSIWAEVRRRRMRKPDGAASVINAPLKRPGIAGEEGWYRGSFPVPSLHHGTGLFVIQKPMAINESLD